MADFERAPADAVHWVATLERQVDFIYRSLRRQGVSAGDLEDLTQEVLLVVWRRWRDYDHARPLRPWLAGIAARVARHHRRRRPPEEPHAFVDTVDPALDLEEQVWRRLQRALALRALARLSEDDRFVLVLHDLEGETVDRIAEHLEVPRSTAFSRLQAARVSFARAVRRLRIAETTAARGRTTAAGLLAAEQADASAPAAVRRRILDRTRSIVLLPRGGERHGPGVRGPGARPSWPLTVEPATAASLCALLLVATSFTADPELSTNDPAAAAPAAPLEAPRERRHPAWVFAATLRTALPVEDRSPWPQGLARGLVGHWRFDEAEGAVATDRSGHRNDCQLRARKPRHPWGDGAADRGLIFQNDLWLECPVSETLARPGAEITVAARVRRLVERRGVQTILARQQPDDKADDLFLGIFNHGPQRDELVLNSRAWLVRVHTDLPAADGRWYHLAATHAADGTTSLFVDGVRKASKASLRAGALSGSKPFLVGGGTNDVDIQRIEQLFQGEIRDLLIYERSLSEEEIAALAAGRLPDLGG